METEFPEQILVLAITDAAGRALTVIFTEFELLHPVAVMVSVSV